MNKEIDLKIPGKLKKLFSTKKRFKVIIGGRGSAKSHTVAVGMVAKVDKEAAKVVCCREFQNSTKDSVHQVLKRKIKDYEMVGFDCQETTIKSESGGETIYRGLARNIDAVKSLEEAKYAWVEEAQTLSAISLKMLTPTIREEDGEIWLTANPQSKKDPFSQRFIVPFQHQLDKVGYYEDDLHLIIVCNWRDNPWFPPSLNQERLYDKEHLSRAEYDHIWEGKYNDEVPDSIIKADWFDACIDSHLKLNIEIKGVEVVSHDPSDTGSDEKGLCYRHGILIKDVQERDKGDVNEGGDWAASYAIEKATIDQFIWDGNGMGIALRRQFNESFAQKRIKTSMFIGSASPDRGDQIYIRGNDEQQKTNKEVFRNKRAQYYWELRDRIYNTYEAVVKNKYINPDTLISFSSEIEDIDLLRAEICRIPRKYNPQGYIQIMTKQEMALLSIESPNMADSVMMSLANEPIEAVNYTKAAVVVPKSTGWT